MSKRILCVDDDPDILDCLNVILSGEGNDVITTDSPSNIFHLMQQHKPDLIIMDINMAGYNGLEVCKAIKSYLGTEQVPVLVISSDQSIEVAVSDFGATDIVLKPFINDLLIEKITSCLTPKVTPLNPEQHKND